MRHTIDNIISGMLRTRNIFLVRFHRDTLHGAGEPDELGSMVNVAEPVFFSISQVGEV